MSTKRVLGIAALGVAFIVCLIGVMTLFSYFRSGAGEVELPLDDVSTGGPGTEENDALTRIEVTAETVQAVIRELKRPENYTRDITVERYWDGGSGTTRMNAAVSGGIISLTIFADSPGADEKRIIVTGSELYIWFAGGSAPFIGGVDFSTGEINSSDEWQMMITYEDVLKLDKNLIFAAGYEEYGGENCIFVEYESRLLGYRTKCYISEKLGLITGAEEYDGNMLVYRMTTGECVVEEPDISSFTLPDGRVLLVAD